MRSICVFCGSSSGNHPHYMALARQTGALLGRENIRLVYGGARIGLMGVVADAALENGAEVHGVIPTSLADKEIAHTGVTKLHFTQTMHERKSLMYDLSDAFVALPGGMGTLDELCEVLTWAQLGLHQKPCILLNFNNYFDHLIAFFERAVTDQFLRPQHRALLTVIKDPEELLECIQKYHPPRLERWIERKDT